MKDLPKFKPRSYVSVLRYITMILTNEHRSPETHLLRLMDYDDGHYRAVFKLAYFLLPEGQPHPTKSQWNSLKKKMKRHDDLVFIFKEHGEIDCEDESGEFKGRCGYIDFGFFAK